MSKDEVREQKIQAEEVDPFKVQIGGSHYKNFVIQPGEFISKNDLKWYEGNIIKYVTRSRFKGQMLEDLKKARHYLDMAIAEEENKQVGQWKTMSSTELQNQLGAARGNTYR